jgi:hypothetical protein
MKTILPEHITTIEEAEKLLTDLHNNGESFHPEDDANDIIWVCEAPTAQECDHLNVLMSDIYNLNGFDPCDFLLNLMNPES